VAVDGSNEVHVADSANNLIRTTRLVPPIPPVIIAQPESQSTLPGSPVMFTVIADGTPPLSFQWRFNGRDLPGATTTSFTIAGAQPTNSGIYTVRVTNDYGAVISSNAILGVVSILVSGDNTWGQAQVNPSATNVISVVAGAWHTLALDPDGTVWGWGYNFDGQCSVPADLRNVVSVAAGGYHSLALKADGTIVGWGANEHGQASPPAGLSEVIAIAAGTAHSIALRADSTVVAWGDNSLGQCMVPAGLTNVVAVAAGGSHTLALLANGAVLAWGENTDALGAFTGQCNVPLGLNGVVAIAAGGYHSLALKSDGAVVAWGDNSEGQCSPPPGLSPAIGIAAGGSHSVALKPDGSVVAWGANWNGQCDLPGNLNTTIGISAGSEHTTVLLGSNTLLARPQYPTWSNLRFRTLVQTFWGKRYALEWKGSLTATNWVALPSAYGTGANQFLLDPAASGPCRFYRLRQW
jgi:hypothetical protein